MMDENGTRADSKIIRLVSVKSGTRCKLVGVSNIGGRRHGPRKHGGLFGGFHKHINHKEHKEVKWQHRGDRQITKRLLDLGLTKGCTFTVVQGSWRGPVLVEVRGTRIALGHGLSRKVLVEILEENV